MSNRILKAAMEFVNKKTAGGFTLLELMVSVSLMGILSLIAVNSLQQYSDPLNNGTAQLIGFIKQVRARAISTTSAYTIKPASSSSIMTVYANTCSATDTTVDPQHVLALPKEVSLGSPAWSICFSSRGLPDDNITVQLNSARGGSKTIEIYLGGAVKEL